MQHAKATAAHEIMDSDKNAPMRLIAAVILQATDDLKIKDTSPQVRYKKDAIEFFWGRNSAMSDAYLTLLNYEPKQFKVKLKALYEENKLAAIANLETA